MNASARRRPHPLAARRLALHAACAALALAGSLPGELRAQQALPPTAEQAAHPPGPPPESDYYRVDYLQPPPDAVLEVGGMDFLSDGRLVVSTRRGQVWLVDQPLAEDPAAARFTLFAEGLDEGLGLKVLPARDGGVIGATSGVAAPDDIYVLQRGELSRLRDFDADGRADHLDTITSDWGLSGNYHEFAYGLPADAQGNLYLSLNVSFFSPDWWLGKSPVPWRGWVLSVAPDRTVRPVASGFRSPCGLGLDADGELFVTDNQGDWMPVGPVFHVQPGRFYGHPASLDWTPAYRRNGAHASATLPPAAERAPAAVWLPYKWSRSAGNLVADRSGGRFGPFANQLFVAEMTNGSVLRCQLERVAGEYQGTCFLFRQRVGSICRVLFAPDGTLLAGFTNRGWGGLPPADGLARIRWTGRLPLEIERVHLLQDGLELSFTQPLAEDCRPAPDDIALTQYDYDYWWEYGSPERHTRKVEVTAVERSADRRMLVVRTAGLLPAMVARCRLSGVRAADGAALLHDEFACTINQLPEGPATTEHVAKVVAPPPPRESEEEGWLRLTWGDALDAWRSEGWRLLDAELDPQQPDTFLLREGDGALVNVGAGPASDFTSRYEFGDARVHVEFMLPEGGASGVYLMGRYGVQLSDDEGCGTLCARGSEPPRAPDFVAYKGAGQWHELDLQWQAPRFDEAGRKAAPARLLRVLLDDVLLHEDIELAAPCDDAPLRGPEAATGPLLVLGGRGAVALRNVRVRPQRPVADEAGWVPIFNGSDLQGWTVEADEPDRGGWTVEDGLLTGRGPRSHLFSPRGDYRDLQLRATLRISDGGNSGLYLRAARGPGWPAGYEAQVNSSFEDSQRTGSIYGLQPVEVSLVPPGTWFEEQVTCRDTEAGTQITVAINGVIVSEALDGERRHASGHVALQQHHDGSIVEVRSLEVRELR